MSDALAHLLACLDESVRLLDESGQDCDARVVESHRAQLAAGREWPGMPIAEPVWPDQVGEQSLADTSPKVSLVERGWTAGD